MRWIWMLLLVTACGPAPETQTSGLKCTGRLSVDPFGNTQVFLEHTFRTYTTGRHVTDCQLSTNRSSFVAVQHTDTSDSRAAGYEGDCFLLLDLDTLDDSGRPGGWFIVLTNSPRLGTYSRADYVEFLSPYDGDFIFAPCTEEH